MVRINEWASIKLGHLIDEEFQPGVLSDTTVYRYETTLAHVRRPDQDSAIASARCGTCEETVYLRIHSVGRARVVRTRWLSLAVASLAVAAAPIYAALIRDPPIPLSSDLMGLALWAGTGLGSTAFVGSLVAGLREDGLRLEWPGPHKLLR